MSRFQKVGVVRKTLANGDWIEIRERLSGSESRRMAAATFTGVKRKVDPSAPEEAPKEVEIAVDFSALPLERMKRYLVDWSFKDDQDKPVRCTPEAIEALDDETFEEIEKILDEHVKEMKQMAKAQSGAPASSQA